MPRNVAAVGDCALCGQAGRLVESHLIPAFVVRAFKEHSATGYMRSAENPNLRQQNARTLPLLCPDCDNVRLSQAERDFAMGIFALRINGTLTSITITEAHLYFAASLTWRSLIFNLRLGGAALRSDGHNDEDLAAMRNAEVQLRAYLMGNATYPEQYQQHLWFSDLTVGDALEGIDAYLRAALDLYIPGHDDYLYAVGNLSFGITMICLLRTDAARLADWSKGGTHLTPGATLSTWGQNIHDSYFGQLLTARSKQLLRYKKVSTRQQAVIAESVKRADMTNWATSWHGSAFVREHEKTQDARQFWVLTHRDDGSPEKTTIPFSAMAKLFGDDDPIMARLNGLEIGTAVKVGMENGPSVVIVRIA